MFVLFSNLVTILQLSNLFSLYSLWSYDMSMEMASERVCYVHCNFCNTILAVSVPSSSSMLTIVTVRCGHCANLLTVNMTPPPPQPHLLQLQTQQLVGPEEMMSKSSSTGSSSSTITATSFESAAEHDPPRTPPIRPPEKKQRVPSAYNKFIKEEIQRIKAINPEITHREAFSLAAKNWAHFPRIHFGLSQANKLLDQAITGEGAHQKSPGFY